MYKYFVFLLVLLASAVIADDGQLRDPTHPIGAVLNTTGVSQPTTLHLNSILLGASRKVATINGQSLMQGQMLKGTDYQLISIQKNAVTLRSGSTTRVLTMVESRVKK